MATAGSSKEMGRKINYCRKHPSFSFAKVSKGESCFVTTRTGKSTRSSIVEITKTLSGVRLLTNKQRACSPRTDGYGARFDCGQTEHRPVACAPSGDSPRCSSYWVTAHRLGSLCSCIHAAPYSIALPQIVAR